MGRAFWFNSSCPSRHWQVVNSLARFHRFLLCDFTIHYSHLCAVPISLSNGSLCTKAVSPVKIQDWGLLSLLPSKLQTVLNTEEKKKKMLSLISRETNWDQSEKKSHSHWSVGKPIGTKVKSLLKNIFSSSLICLTNLSNLLKTSK